jgi:hypothetical protein
MSAFTVASLHSLQQVKSTTHTLQLPNDKATGMKQIKRLPSDDDTKERKAAEQHQTSSLHLNLHHTASPAASYHLSPLWV